MDMCPVSDICTGGVTTLGMPIEHLSFTVRTTFTAELQWFEQLWNHEKMFETGVVRANECLS